MQLRHVFFKLVLRESQFPLFVHVVKPLAPFPSSLTKETDIKRFTSLKVPSLDCMEFVSSIYLKYYLKFSVISIVLFNFLNV